MLWVWQSYTKPCLWAPWPKTGSCSSWRPSWDRMEPWGTPAGAWIPSRISCCSSSDHSSPHRANEEETGVGGVMKRKGWLKDILLLFCLFKLQLIEGSGGGGHDEACWDWSRRISSSWTLSNYVSSVLEKVTSSSSPFVSFHSFLLTRFVLFTREEEVQREGDEDRRWVCWWICESEPQSSPLASDSHFELVLTSTCSRFIPACRWCRLWNVDWTISGLWIHIQILPGLPCVCDQGGQQSGTGNIQGWLV